MAARNFFVLLLGLISWLSIIGLSQGVAINLDFVCVCVVIFFKEPDIIFPPPT